MIKAMEHGIIGMKAGGRREVTVPSPLAYGTRGYPPLIPENATLIFDIQLISIE
jgi:FKBP-type peptidyl-prolyl cis-trans isomerase